MLDILPILARYGTAFERLRWVPIGSGGGFSGSLLWRGEADGTPLFALKAWPETMTAERLLQIHGWMEQASHLAFVPRVVQTLDRFSLLEHAGRIWELTRWMPGIAEYHANPTPERLANICTVLAELHRAWKSMTPRLAPCPAVERRLRILAEWKHRLQGNSASDVKGKAAPPLPAGERSLFRCAGIGTAGEGPHGDVKASAPHPVFELHSQFENHPLPSGERVGGSNLDDLLRRGAELVAPLIELAERALTPWTTRPVPVQPCLCDVWHDHVLFSGDAVTGIIDFGAMKEDHVAVDLARMLGDFLGEDEITFELGLTAYRAAGGVHDVPVEFVRLLDRTGIVCGMIVWWLRFLDNSRGFSDPRAVINRVARLVARLEAFRGF